MNELAEKLKKIKIFITDVDGVLTDGRIILGSNGLELKAFHAQDGLGLHLAQKAGLKTAIITGRYSEAVERRGRELAFDYVFQGVTDKKSVLREILTKEGLNLNEAAYIGDDLNDLPILKLAGVKLAVNNAVNEVKEAADYVTRKDGGCGAVREAVELILKAQDKWEKIMSGYLEKTRGVQ